MCEHDLTPLPPTTVSRRRMMIGSAVAAALLPWRRAGAGRAGSSPNSDPAFVERVEVVPGLFIFPRSAWGSDLPARSELRSEDVKFLLVHHSATANGPVDARRFIRSVYSFHTGPEKRWPDVCYQFFIDPDGGIWEGRAGAIDGPVVADATGGSQGFAQLVCLIGDFTRSLPNENMLASLRHLLAWLAERSGLETSPGASATFSSRGSQRWSVGTSITTPTINGHRSMSYTDCPGDALLSYVTGSLQADVHALRSTMRGFDPPVDDTGLMPARRGVRRTLRS
jgi:N-acetylmuramoyl-L-alanine amidase